MNDPLIGKQLANYRLERVLGRGGMAQVFYAWDVQLERAVAVKVIDSRYRENTTYARRFIQEARTVAAWRHENIVQIFYAGEEESVYFFAMEYIDGEDLSQRLGEYARNGDTMPHSDVIRIGNAVANALDHAHWHGVIHRDVKPSNVMLARDGRVVLTDFGLALDVAQGSLGETFGTPHYISPEQARKSSEAVPQSDLYSLGVILYEMLTGVVPFDDPSPTSVVLQHVTQPPPPPRSINPNLNTTTERVLLKILSKLPQERYTTGREFMDALALALHSQESLPETREFQLPPMPAGVDLPPTAIGMQAAPAPQFATDSVPRSNYVITQTMQPVQGESKKAMLMAVAGGLLALGVLAIALIGFLVLGNGGDDDDDPNANPTATSNMAVIDVTNPPTLTTEPTVEASPTVDDVVDAPTTAPSLTVEVNPTTAPSLTSPPPTGVPTSTLAPPTDAPTITIAPPSPTAEPTQPQGEATVLYPDGKRFVLLYNYTSFYMLNRSGENFSISRIAFEALDSQDQAVMAASSSNPIAVEGGRWARFYPTLENNNCVRAEISNASGWLRPEQCGAYNATITPTATDSQGFWRVRSEPTVIFRVMLDGQEIARCPLADETIASLRCEFRIP